MTYTIFNSLHNPQGQQLTAQWADICRMLQDAATYPDKAGQPLIKFGTFDNASRGQGSSLTTISGIELDYDAGEVTAHSAAKMLRDAGIECVVCSTYTSRTDYPKWRVFAPTSRELPAALRQHLVNALDAVIGNIAARESYTPKQTFFYGRNPASNYVYMHIKGEFVDVALRSAANAAYQSDKRERAEREQLATARAVHIETQRTQRQGGRLVEGQVSPIAAFNDAHDVRAILTTHGYRANGSKFVAPASSSGMAGVVILQGDDGRERAFSHHSNDPIADGLAHDAFDLFCILDHAGDEWAALQAAAKLLTTTTGISLQAHNQITYRKHRAMHKARATLANIQGKAS
ncbi:hypothetical protein [Thiothrix lacustris]|uniref:hypothetical protein n=1 Tax=Thiothrix lacustris TaxID=525917 RepID=UPI0027E58ACE|nr:hypothetical protein [Thiothrix lacustris]WMP16962.1 hypothetical protein RCS87_16510 [Thiothrix lacustris]